jgi:hypothetical protein
MPVIPSSQPDDATPRTPNDGTAETGAGNWPPRDRDPFDPACGPGQAQPPRDRESSERKESERKE